MNAKTERWWMLLMMLGVLATGSTHATTALWTNTANGTVDSWTTAANWNAASYPGADGTYQNAFLTNRVSGSVYKAVVNANLLNPLGTVEIRNNGGSGGEAWVIVTNATVTITNLLVRTQGRIEIDAAGVVTNATVTMDGTNGQILVNSGGSLFSVTNIYVGGNSAATAFGTNNSLTIGDNGVVSTLSSLVVGYGSSYNTLSVPGNNVMIRTSNTLYFGFGSSCNRTLVTGSNTVWDCGNQNVRMGGQGSGGHSTNNVLMVSGGSLMLTNHTTFIVGFGYGTGPDSSLNSIIVTNGGHLYTRNTVGVGDFASSNAVIVTGAGSLWDNNGGKVQVGYGYGSTNNQVLVDQGGTISNCYINVGDNTMQNYANSLIVTNNSRIYTMGASAVGIFGTNSSAVVTGTGSVWNLGAQTLSVGYMNKSTNAFNTLRIDNGATITNGVIWVGNGVASFGNTLMVTNGGQLFCLTGTVGNVIGSLCSSNLAVINGPSSFWNCNTQAVTVGTGAGASNNVLRIENGAVATNAGVLTVGQSGGFNNMMVVTNGGQLCTASGAGTVGNSASSNLMVISGSGTFWNCGIQSVTVGAGVSASNNVLRVENGAVVTNSGIPSVGGNGGVNNMLIVTNGGQYWVAAGYSGGMGGSASSNLILIAGNNATFGGLGAYCNLTIGSPLATGNVMVVDNGGFCPTWAAVSVGKLTNCVGNLLIITNGGYLQGTAVYANFRGTNNWSNAVVVVNGGVLESPSLICDSGGDLTPLNGYNCITNSGGVYQFTTITPTITPVPAHNSLIYLDSGTIAYRALSTVNVKGNLPGSNGTALTNITYAANGHNGFRLNSATNVTSPDQSYTFATGLGATNYARLELINGSQYRGGSVTIGNGGTLAMWGAPSTITNLTIGANGALEVTLNGTSNTNQLIAVGSVALGGSLNVILAGPPPPAGWSATLINKTSPGALTGRFGNAPLRASYLGTNYAFSATYTSSTLVLNSQGKVTTGTVLLFQ